MSEPTITTRDREIAERILACIDNAANLLDVELIPQIATILAAEREKERETIQVALRYLESTHLIEHDDCDCWVCHLHSNLTTLLK